MPPTSCHGFAHVASGSESIIGKHAGFKALLSGTFLALSKISLALAAHVTPCTA